jgi:hypothetical protein
MGTEINSRRARHEVERLERTAIHAEPPSARMGANEVVEAILGLIALLPILAGIGGLTVFLMLLAMSCSTGAP